MTGSPGPRAKSQPGCLVSALWFVCVGSWASLIAVTVAWLCMATVIGIPLGVAIINKIPWIVALRTPDQAGVQPIKVTTETTVRARGVTTSVTTTVIVDPVPPPRQRSFLVRAVWFVAIGCWASTASRSAAGH